MENGFTIRWGWLRAMYLYTLVGAGGTRIRADRLPGCHEGHDGIPGPGSGRPRALRLCPAGVRPDRDPRPSRSPEIRPYAPLAARLQAALARRLRYPALPQRPVPEVCRRHVRRIPHLYHRRPDRHPVRLPVLEETFPLAGRVRRRTRLRGLDPGGDVQE
ncbi:MAG: hypothetical protein M0C28_47160 [Candidatus Moduliflexus flocculans]|nr:hypothetical protein [Candidatus Moduliflexus flocculans]